MSDITLSVKNLSVSYATSRGRFQAVRDVSFSIRAGETFGLVGESGSGKTTTAMSILRLIRPPARIEGGQILLEGTDLLQTSGDTLRRMRWSKISLIPQGAMNSLNPVMRVKDQIADVIVTHEGRQPATPLQERIVHLLETVGLPERTYFLYPHELSGGMKQRVCIAMAIALNPKMIVADEPTSALDVVVQRLVAETLKDVQRRMSAAMILIGHDMGLQAQVADRIGVMYAGRLVEVGPVRAIFKNPCHPYTQLLIASIPSIKKKQAERLPQRWTEAAKEELQGEILFKEVEPEHFVAMMAERRSEQDVSLFGNALTPQPLD